MPMRCTLPGHGLYGRDQPGGETANHFSLLLWAT